MHQAFPQAGNLAFRKDKGSAGAERLCIQVCAINPSSLQISDHEARALIDERFHPFFRQHLRIVQHRVVRQRLDGGPPGYWLS